MRENPLKTPFFGKNPLFWGFSPIWPILGIFGILEVLTKFPECRKLHISWQSCRRLSCSESLEHVWDSHTTSELQPLHNTPTWGVSQELITFIYQAYGDGTQDFPVQAAVWKVQEYTTVYFLNASGCLLSEGASA